MLEQYDALLCFASLFFALDRRWSEAKNERNTLHFSQHSTAQSNTIQKNETKIRWNKSGVVWCQSSSSSSLFFWTPENIYASQPGQNIVVTLTKDKTRRLQCPSNLLVEWGWTLDKKGDYCFKEDLAQLTAAMTSYVRIIYQSNIFFFLFLAHPHFTHTFSFAYFLAWSRRQWRTVAVETRTAACFNTDLSAYSSKLLFEAIAAELTHRLASTDYHKG